MRRELLKTQAAYVDDITRAAKTSPHAGALEVIKFVYDQHLVCGDSIAECFNHVLTAINYFSGVPIMLSRADDSKSQDHLGDPLRDAIETARGALKLPEPVGASTYRAPEFVPL